MKTCPFCKTDLLDTSLVDHLHIYHIEIYKILSPNDSGHQVTTDDSGRLISIEEYAELHGERARTEDDEKKYLNLMPLEKKKHGITFQEIAQIKEKSQPKPKGQLKIECRYCHKFVERDKLREHNILKHLDEMPSKSKPNTPKTPRSKPKDEKDDDVTFAPEGQDGNIAEKLRQALDETRYGEKGMHHRHEWDGKFGSTPLHDDYSDESDSE